MPEIQEHPPPILKTLMVGSLGGDAGDLGAPTSYLEDIMAGPLGGDGGDPRACTTNLEDVDGGLPGR
jgi:hypothetical protein